MPPRSTVPQYSRRSAGGQAARPTSGQAAVRAKQVWACRRPLPYQLPARRAGVGGRPSRADGDAAHPQAAVRVGRRHPARGRARPLAPVGVGVVDRGQRLAEEARDCGGQVLRKDFRHPPIWKRRCSLNRRNSGLTRPLATDSNPNAR